MRLPSPVGKESRIYGRAVPVGTSFSLVFKR